MVIVIGCTGGLVVVFLGTVTGWLLWRRRQARLARAAALGAVVRVLLRFHGIIVHYCCLNYHLILFIEDKHSNKIHSTKAFIFSQLRLSI